MDFDRPNFPHDVPDVCVNKLFNMVQACRTDAAIMRGRRENYKIDPDLVKAAEALAQELKSMA